MAGLMLAAGAKRPAAQTQGTAMTHDDTPQQPYRGPNRRKGSDRRKTNDRRDEIRFEPQKDDRRSGKDRRKHGGWDDTLTR